MTFLHAYDTVDNAKTMTRQDLPTWWSAQPASYYGKSYSFDELQKTLTTPTAVGTSYQPLILTHLTPLGSGYRATVRIASVSSGTPAQSLVNYDVVPGGTRGFLITRIDAA